MSKTTTENDDLIRLESQMRALVNALRMPDMHGKLSMDARCQLIAAETLLLEPQIRARRRDLLATK